ncbi:hypothetical protein [Shewanella xiamenensis]|uniref:hypothetical protein n=1 Tax=Shewanella xiamenensis TaxID=332186 RepID=UPI00222E9CB4|nr:hypothetical protein [Shewanella xiamenensis]
MGELIGYADQITSYGFSSTDLGNKAVVNCSESAGSLQQSAVVAFRDVRSNRSVLAESP